MTDMKYMGSKDKYAKHLLPFILADRKPEQWYVELFAGGMNMIDKVPGNRIANDINKYLIELFKNLVNGWQPPKEITREFYNKVFLNKNQYPPELVGYIGFCCSYSGKWFGGYAGKTKTKIGIVRDYQDEAIRNISRQIPKLQNVQFLNCDYFNVKIPEKSIIYCDPPYQGTTEYLHSKFNSQKLFDFLREKKDEGHTVFLSEYSAPIDFKCLIKLTAKSSLSANGKIGGSKESVEKLFTL